MKKKLVAILSVVASLSMFAACADLTQDPTSSNSTPPEQSSSPACTHVYDDDCDADCNVCGEERTPSDHVYDNDCDADCNVCGEERTPSDHVYDADCDTDCNVCGETREAGEHTYADTLTMGIATHWYAATCGHSDAKKDEAAHVWGEGEVTTEPGLEKGERTYTCKCGATKTEELPATKANVVYYVGEDAVYTETVDIGGTVAYAEEPTQDGYIFVGWFATAEDAANPTADKIVDMTAAISESKNLYAGFAQMSVVMPAMLAEYQQGTEVEIPTVSVSFLGNAVNVSVSAVAPNGEAATINENKLSLSEVGEYVVTCTAEFKGVNVSKEMKLNSVEFVEYMATNGATVNTDGEIPGGWGSGMLVVDLQAGGSATLNTVMDWTGKTLDNSFFGYQGAFDKMTAAEYADKDFTITFTNVENASQSVSLVHTQNSDGQVIVSVYEGNECIWSNPIGKYMGSDLVDVWGRLFTVKFYEGGIDINGNNIALTNFYTKAVVSMSSENGSAAAFSYVADNRNWQAYNATNAVNYYVGDTLHHTENVKLGQYATYNGTPDGAFMGWFTSQEAADTMDEAYKFDASKRILGETNLYACMMETTLSLAKPMFPEYMLGGQVAIPAGTIKYLATSGEANASLIAPNGDVVALTDGVATLNQLGKYTIKYELSANDVALSESVTFNCVSSLGYMSVSNASYNTNAAIPGGWDSGMLSVSLNAGGVATLNTVMDWTGKTADSNYFAFQPFFDKMTAAEYAGTDLSVVFTNVDDASQTLEIKHTCGESNQYTVSVIYNGVSKWSYPIGKFMGSDLVDLGGRSYNFIIYEGGCKVGTSEVILENFFTKAIVSITSTTGSATSFGYVGDARGWQAYNAYATPMSANSSVNTNAAIPGGWDSGMFSATVAANDVVRVNSIADWSDTTKYNASYAYIAFQIFFDKLTSAEYVGTDLTVTLTNVEDSSQYLSVKHTCASDKQIIVTVTYNGKQLWSNPIGKFMGSDLVDYAGRGYMFRLYENACTINNSTTVALENFFTKAYVTISSTSGSTAAFSYINHARGWQ